MCQNFNSKCYLTLRRESGRRPEIQRFSRSPVRRASRAFVLHIEDASRLSVGLRFHSI